MKLLAILPLLPALLLADVGLKQGATAIGNVKDLSCVNDGGFLCSRDAGVGNIRCAGATATETGCVTPSAQTFAGDKTFTGDPRIVGHVHGSLTACSSGVKGMWQTCTTHNAPVFCDGTSNVEMLGLGNEVAFPSFYINGLLHSNLLVLSAWTLPYSYTVTGFTGFIGAGAGTTQTLRFSDGTNNCDCSVSCAGGQTFTCSGNCTYAADTQVVSTIPTDGCTTPPTVKGLLVPHGYK